MGDARDVTAHTDPSSSSKKQTHNVCLFYKKTERGNLRYLFNLGFFQLVQSQFDFFCPRLGYGFNLESITDVFV